VAINIEDKKQIVSEVNKAASGALSAVLADYRGIDVADNYIVEHVLPGDLVVTADIPLAALVVGKNAVALNPRGTLYNEENIGTHLARRNFMDELRSTGAVTGGPDAFGKVDQQTFANALDRWLAKRE